METRVMTAHIPIPLAEKVDVLAEQLERSRGWIIKQALAAWVAEEEIKREMILEAIADVRAGRVVDDEVVQAWADSLDTDNPLPAPTL
ncbi:MAG: ribbon-helix-helix domain-containing protein [Chloroflexota bacterium]|nr:ribbon-helix-helix domain-containing protein [Chloroflexota bacterium]